MGAEPYFYYVSYQKDVNAALQALRQREFQAGRYNPVMQSIDFPVGPGSPAPGAQHASIEEAFEEADADGTRSILDLDRIADEPDYGAVTPLDPKRIEELFGTYQPTRTQVENNLDFFDDIDRGQGIYIVLYKDGQPDELMFAGYSFD